MTELDRLAQSLAVAIARLAVAERAAAEALVIAECAIANAAHRARVPVPRVIGHAIDGAPIYR